MKKYLEELQPACVDGDSTYEDRKDARDAEIKAPKNAGISFGIHRKFVIK